MLTVRIQEKNHSESIMVLKLKDGAISMKNCVEKRNTIGAPGTEAMKQVIQLHKKYLEENS